MIHIFAACYQYVYGTTKFTLRKMFARSSHADLYTVSRCRTRGESQEFIVHRWQSTQVRDPPGFETQGRCRQKSKTGVSVASKIFFKKRKMFARKSSKINPWYCEILDGTTSQ